MVKCSVPLLLSLILLCSCTDLTEFKSAIEAGVHVIDSSDLSLIGSVTGIDGARSLCLVPGSFLVASTEGSVSFYDLETLAHERTSQVDFSSPAGFSRMIYSPMENSVYLIGSLGKIIEINAQTGEVIDAFSICESPIDLLMAGNNRPYLYVADTAAERILEVRIETNGVSRFCQMLSAPRAIAEDHRPDTMFVVTLESADILSTKGAGVIYRRTLDNSMPFLAAADMPDDTVLCAVMRAPYTDMVVTIPAYFPSSMPKQQDYQIWTGPVALEGDMHIIRTGADRTHAYVLSYLGNSVSRLSSYNYNTYSLDGQMDLSGYPMDLTVSVTGEILVLTTE